MLSTVACSGPLCHVLSLLSSSSSLLLWTSMRSWRATVATPGELQCGVRRLSVANGPNILQMLLVAQICDSNHTFCYRPSLVACSGNYNWWAVQYGRFLPRDAMLSAVYAVVVCLSLCLCVSVTVRNCIKTAKRRITQIMPHDRVFK